MNPVSETLSDGLAGGYRVARLWEAGGSRAPARHPRPGDPRGWSPAAMSVPAAR